MRDLTISIVTRDNKQQLRECIDSIYSSLEGLSFEICVVDDASKDKTGELILNSYKQIKLLTNKKTVSFAYSHNRILKTAQSEYIVILNDDTVIFKNALKRIIAYLKENPQVGAVGPKMKDMSGNYQQTAFKFPNVLDLFADYFYNKIMTGNKFSALYKNIQLIAEPKEVDWLLGACLVIPREVIEKIGCLDERFTPGYMEDTDFCKRIKNAGYKIIYYPEAEIAHRGAQSTQKRRLFMVKALYKNRLTFFKKHYGYMYYLFSKFILYTATVCNIAFDVARFLCFRTNKNELLQNLREYIYISS
ncbi:MAG: glycosyltransferase family 2 protein [Candidatus Omnitrophota bacterium]